MNLADLQGNVLQGYGLKTAAYVNLSIHVGDHGRRLLSDLVDSVTDAQRWYDGRPETTLNLAIAFQALERLGITERERVSFPFEYRDGMAARARRLGDIDESDPRHWNVGRIDVLAIIHAADIASRAREVERLTNAVAGYRGVRAAVVGEAELLAGGGREHFGFMDGFGQPAIEGQTGPTYKGQGVPVKRRFRKLRWRLIQPGEFVVGERNEDGITEPAPARPLGANGTFMVFRKLEQNVAAFRALVDRLAVQHFNGDRDLTMAKIAGRWPDGTPLMRSPYRQDPTLAADRWRTNDFHYGGDPRGLTCPLGAHVRRANPRDGLFNGGDRTRRHRIIRRGMPYGPVLPPGDPDDGRRGLFFVCLNASIARQFETVNNWLRRGDAFGLEHGDLLTDATRAGAMTVQADGPVLLRTADGAPPLVITRGGEYLWLPGKRALAELARGPDERAP